MPLQGPTPQDLARIFEGAGSPEERLRRLVSELAAFYQRGGAELQKALTEALLSPLSATSYMYQRRARGMSTDRIAQGYEFLVRRLLA